MEEALDLSFDRLLMMMILSSTCFGYIRPSSGALDVELQHMVLPCYRGAHTNNVGSIIRSQVYIFFVPRHDGSTDPQACNRKGYHSGSYTGD